MEELIFHDILQAIMIKTILSKLSGKEKEGFLLLTIIVGILVLWPLHNFQHYLAQGDHHLTHNGFRFDIPFLIKELRRWSPAGENSFIF